MRSLTELEVLRDTCRGIESPVENMSIASSFNRDVLLYKNAFGQAPTEVRLDRDRCHFLQVIEAVRARR